MQERRHDRTSLEKAIATASWSIHEDDAIQCLDAQSVESFFQAWRALVRYYEQNSDTSIGVEVVREYLDRLMIFSTIWHSVQRPSNCREMAQEACEELELYMDGIIKAVDSRLYPTGR